MRLARQQLPVLIETFSRMSADRPEGILCYTKRDPGGGPTRGWSSLIIRSRRERGVEQRADSGRQRVARDRGLPTGIWNCASSLGPTIAPPRLTVLMISFGWRWMFVSMGLIGNDPYPASP
jgi:hypothetical protein